MSESPIRHRIGLFVSAANAGKQPESQQSDGRRDGKPETLGREAEKDTLAGNRPDEHSGRRYADRHSKRAKVVAGAPEIDGYSREIYHQAGRRGGGHEDSGGEAE